MGEEDKLKEDIRKMFSGLAGQRPAVREEVSEGDDIESEMESAKQDLGEIIRDVVMQTITVESLQKIAEEKGIVQRIGQVGMRDVISDLRNKIEEMLDPGNW